MLLYNQIPQADKILPVAMDYYLAYVFFTKWTLCMCLAAYLWIFLLYFIFLLINYLMA